MSRGLIILRSHRISVGVGEVLDIGYWEFLSLVVSVNGHGIIFCAGNEYKVMVHGQENNFWFFPSLEQQLRKLGEAILLAEVSHLLILRITCNVSLLSISTSRI